MPPWKLAAIFSGIYAISGAAYILLSDKAASALAGSMSELVWFQMAKGLGYIGVTALMIFLVVNYFLQRLEEKERQVQSHRERLLAAERRATAGHLAMSITHDANNLVTVIQSNLEIIMEDQELDPEVLADLDYATRELRALLERVRDRATKNVNAGHRTVVDPCEEVGRVVELMSRHSRLRGRTIEFEPANECGQRSGRPLLLRQAMVNLVLNAADAAGMKGRILVRMSADDGVQLEVHDDGPGFSEDFKDEKAFEPFLTSKEKGSGLGLLAVQECARAHGGSVVIGDSEILGGACVRLDMRMERGEDAG